MAINQRRAGAMMSMAYSAVQVVVGLIYVPLLLNGIGKSEYGLYQIVGSIISYLGIVSTTLSSGVTRYYCKCYVEDDRVGMENVLGTARRLYRFAVPMILVVAAIFAVAMRLIYSESLTPQEIDESMVMLAVLAVNAVVTMYNTLANAVLSAHERFVVMNGVLLATTIIQPVCVVLVIQQVPYAAAITFVQFGLNIIVWLFQAAYARRRLGMVTELHYLDRDLQRGLLTFSGAILLGVVADQIFWKTDQLVIAYFYGSSAVAVYAVASQVFNSYMALGYAVSSVFLPKISELYHKERDFDGIDAIFRKVGRIAFLILFLILSGFVIFGEDFIALWAGDGFKDAYLIAVIIMVPYTVDVMQNIGLTILKVVNRYYVRARLYLIAAVINIILTIVFVANFGLVGAAVATAIAVTVVSIIIMNVYYGKSLHLNMKQYWVEIARLAAPLAVLLALVFCLKLFVIGTISTWPAMGVCVLLYALVYFAVSYLLGMNEYEKSVVIGYVRHLVPCLRDAE